MEGSPAAKAGLRQGDVITDFDGGPAGVDVDAFQKRVALTTPGSRAQITVLRDNRKQNLSVTIGALSEDEPDQ